MRGEAATLTCVNHMRNIHNYLTMSFRWTVRNIAWTVAATEPANRTLVSPICAYKDRFTITTCATQLWETTKNVYKKKKRNEGEKSVETTLYKLNGGFPTPLPFTLFSFISVYEMNKYMFIFFHMSCISLCICLFTICNPPQTRQTENSYGSVWVLSIVWNVV